MKTIAVIPARAGSKRLPNKNISDLGGKPLLCWTLEAALDSNVFDDVYVSTDSYIIGEIANEWARMPVVLDRSPSLAEDDTPMLSVVLDVANHVPCDLIFLLQPTSPFRTAQDIINVYDQMMASQGDAVVSVTDATSDMVFQVGHANRMRPRHDIVVPNGAIYAISTEALLRGEDWYSGVSYVYRMPKDRSLDIDTEVDLELARMMLARKAA